jgi:hypothetical protein
LASSLRRAPGPRGLAALLLATPLLALGQPAADSDTAQPVDYEDWYQIELIAFRQLYPSDTERYQGQPPQILPEDLRWLLPSDAELARLDAERQARRAAEELAADEATAPTETARRDGEATAADLAPDADSAAPEQQAIGPTPPRAMARLETDARLRDDTAQRIRRSRGYRLLAHEAWRQPLPEGGATTRVLLQGGEEFGEHRELEGYVEFDRARYLHVGAHLWLSRFEPAGELSGEPVPLPQLPAAPPVLPLEEPTVVGPVPGWTDAAPDEPVDVVLGPDGLPRGEDEAGAAYRPVESWVLRERRRLRSGELHYLDHPRFGLLVYIEPWEPAPPEPAASD